MVTKQKKGIDVSKRLKRIFKGRPYEPEVTEEFERKDLSRIQMEPYEKEKEIRREMKEKEEKAKEEVEKEEEEKKEPEEEKPKKEKQKKKETIEKEIKKESEHPSM